MGDLVPFLPRVVRGMTDDEVTFTLAYLADVVDRRLERAGERVFLAVDADMPTARTEFMGLARADYAAAHVVASLVDDRVYDCNEMAGVHRVGGRARARGSAVIRTWLMRALYRLACWL